MGVLEIIFLIIILIEFVVCVVLYFERKKAQELFTFMADMVKEEGGALQKALEELKETSKYADPAEAAAAISEIVRFLDSFNSTVRKQSERVEESLKHKWHHPITGLLKKKKVEYTLPSKKKDKEKKETEAEPGKPEEEEDEELKAIEEKIAGKQEERKEDVGADTEAAVDTEKPKKLRRLKRFRRPLKKTSPESGEASEEGGAGSGEKKEEKPVTGDSDTDIDLTPPEEA
jgi:hypothetical protein